MRIEQAPQSVVDLHYAKKRRNGIWDGVVASIEDPSKTGKVRVRIPLLHGMQTSDKDAKGEPYPFTPDSYLPWADVAYMGGGYDWGEFDPPPVGTSVLVGFKMGDEQYPIILGCIRGKPTEAQNLRDNKEGGTEPRWATPAGEIETPKDIFNLEEEGNIHPTRRTWRKSFKGHTLTVEEKDGAEYLKIIDRGGQVIEMNCPVTEEVNKTIGAQRGTRDATTDTQIDQDDLQDHRGFIRMMDSSGQEVLVDGRAGNEQIVIRNQNRSGSRAQTLTFSNHRGDEYVELVDQIGNTVKFSSRDDARILLQDSQGSQITIGDTPTEGTDLASEDNSLLIEEQKGQILRNTITIKPRGRLIIEAGSDQLVTVKGNFSQETQGVHTLNTMGNHELTVAADQNTSIVGGAKIGVGGTISAAIGGMDTSLVLPIPNPLKYAVDIAANAGGLRFLTVTPGADIQLVNGGLTPGASLSSLQMNAAGGINMMATTNIFMNTLATLLANATGSAMITSGSSMMLTSGGVFQADGTQMFIGAGAVDPAILGATFLNALGAWLTVILGLAGNPVSPFAPLAGPTELLLNMIPTFLSTKVKIAP